MSKRPGADKTDLAETAAGGATGTREAASGGYSSPPCFMHELDPVYLGYLPADEVLALLTELLEAERAGAKGTTALARAADDPALRAALTEVGRDEARFCAMLSGHIARLGGEPSRRTGAFYEKLLAVEGAPQRMALLNRGQGWVARKLRDAVPHIHDDALREDLRAMLRTHEENIARCTPFAE